MHLKLSKLTNSIFSSEDQVSKYLSNMDIHCPCRKLAQQMAKMSEEQRAELVRARKAVALQVGILYSNTCEQNFCKYG